MAHRNVQDRSPAPGIQLVPAVEPIDLAQNSRGVNWPDQGHDKPLSYHWRATGFDLASVSDFPNLSDNAALAMTSIIMDLWLEAMGDDREISYSRRKQWYAIGTRYRHSAFTYHTVTRCVDLLAQRGLITHNKAPGSGPSGIQSTMRANAELLALALPEGLHYALYGTVRLRRGGELVDYRDTDQSLRARKATQAINEALISIHADLPGVIRVNDAVWKAGNASLNPMRTTLFRSFSEDWRHGGRFYGGWWVNCPKDWRRRITIDGYATAEEDYPAHHLRMAYAQARKTMPEGDAYTVVGFARDIGKQAMQTLLNATGYHSAWYATARVIECDTRNDADYRGNLSEQSLARARELLRALKAMHHPISGLFHTGIGLRFQRLDSDMMARILLRLQRRGVVGLPVHDSVIVPEQHAGIAYEAMEEAFHHVMGIAA
jgi:hypothetical protein